ncbi:MAG: carboxyl transferase domain-containing protein [Pseudomonadota bacterium]
MSWRDEIEDIERRRARAKLQGGAEAVARQHAKGRLTIRERIAALLDEDSFEEVGAGAGAMGEDGFEPANYVLGFGEIGGRPCIVGGEDFTMKGGSPSPAGLRKSVYAETLALQQKLPLIRLHEGAGGSVGGAGKASTPAPVYEPSRFVSVAELLATAPVASAALGAVAGMPAARLVSSHYAVMAEEVAQILIAGPAVVQRALGEVKTKEELGGAKVHGRAGTVDGVEDTELEAFAAIRRFLSYLPTNIWAKPPYAATDDPADRVEDALAEIVPRERRQAFDMRRALRLILDKESFFEIGARYGRGQITGFARLSGHAVGVWANDGRHLAGAMTADGAQKARRFLELCETFHLPVVAFIDEPGFMIGSQSESEATIRHGAATVLTAASMRVPWASVMVRRSFGVAQAAHYGPGGGLTLAWPSAEAGALPVEGGVAVAYHREIAAAADPEAKRRELEEALAARQSPFPRAEAFAVHELIDPRETRARLCRWAARAQPLLAGLLGPSRFGFRP